MKRILVTGGTGTLGSGLVKMLCQANYSVTTNFYRDATRAAKLHDQTGCALFQGDMSDEKTVVTLFETARFEAVFHLVGSSHDALLPRISPRNWEDSLKTNLHSAFFVTRAALQTLPRGGHLVLVSSRVGERGFIGQSAYGAGKAALLGLMKSAAQESRENGVCVNAICPGFAASKLSASLSDEMKRRREAQNWIPAADATQSFASLGLWLLKTQISGQIFRSDCRI